MTDEELLAQFEALLQAVAREVGKESVAPHLTPIKQTVSDHAAALKQHQQALAKALREQERELQRAQEQASRRELQASEIMDRVREIIEAGLATNRESFDAAVDSLWRGLDGVAAAQRQGVVTLQEAVERATAEVAQGSGLLAERHQALARNLAALEERLAPLLELLRRIDAIADERSREANQAAARIEKIVEVLCLNLEERDQKRDKAAAIDRKRQAAVAAGAVEEQMVPRLQALEQEIVRLAAAVDELARQINAPRGLAKLLQGGNG